MQNTNSQPQEKKNLIISGVVILAVLVALFVAPMFNNKEAKEVVEETTEENVATTTPTQTALSRADATAKYAGTILRFSGDCQADPAEMSAPTNTTIMIDNTTDARRTITIGAKSYSVGSQRYTLSWLNTGPGELPVTCDGKVVGKVIVK